MFVDCSLNIEARVNPLVVAQINPIVFHSRSLCAEYISVRHKVYHENFIIYYLKRLKWHASRPT